MTFPTTTTPAITSTEVFPPRIAAALLTFAAQVIADVTTLFSGTTGENQVRAVLNSIGAYTGTGTGTLTVTATTALPTADGVTLAVGDVVLLPAGTTNISAAADAGPYVVTALGGSGAHAVFTRPTWWAHGATMAPGVSLQVSEGTQYAGVAWKCFATRAASVVDTNDPLLYPKEVGLQVTLSSGVFAITTIPIRSASKSTVVPTLSATGGTVTTTVGYEPFAITPGAIGTASVTVTAVAAGLGTNASDASVLNVLIRN